MRNAMLAMLLLGIAGSALAASPYDGVYVGNAVVQPGSSGNCVWRTPLAVRVTDGRIRQTVGYAQMDGTVAQDGSFNLSGQAQLAHAGTWTQHFNGRIAAGVMNAAFDTQYCHYVFTMPRR